MLIAILALIATAYAGIAALILWACMEFAMLEDDR